MIERDVDPSSDRPQYLWTNRRPALRLVFNEPCSVAELYGTPETEGLAPEALSPTTEDLSEHAPDVDGNEYAPIDFGDTPTHLTTTEELPSQSVVPDVDLQTPTTTDRRYESDRLLIGRIEQSKPLYRAHHAMILQLLTKRDSDLGKDLRRNVVKLLATAIVNRSVLPNDSEIVPQDIIDTVRARTSSGAIAEIGRSHVEAEQTSLREYISAVILTFQSFDELDPMAVRTRIFMPSDALNNKLRTWLKESE